MAAQNEMKETLKNIVAGKILYDEPMSRYASLKLGGKADALVMVEDEDQLVSVVKRLREKKLKFLPVGNLTNMIVRDGGDRGAIILMRGLNKIEYEFQLQSGHCIRAQAGASLGAVVNKALKEELTGFEFCAGIPGSVGGAVWMNAGAYGKEMKDVVKTVSLLNAKSVKTTMRRDEISFSYRKSGLPTEAIILGAMFLLDKGQKVQIQEKVSEILKWRQDKHPLDYPNAGSIFKNLPGQPAGKLIEEMGFKGFQCGDAQVSLKHANFIVNKGRATAADVLELVTLIQDKVKKEKGINLETEVEIVGEN